MKGDSRMGQTANQLIFQIYQDYQYSLYLMNFNFDHLCFKGKMQTKQGLS